MDEVDLVDRLLNPYSMPYADYEYEFEYEYGNL